MTCIREVNRAAEGVWFESLSHGWFFQQGAVAFLGFAWRYVANGLYKPAIVEPIQPLQRRECGSLERAHPVTSVSRPPPKTRGNRGALLSTATTPAWKSPRSQNGSPAVSNSPGPKFFESVPDAVPGPKGDRDFDPPGVTLPPR